MADNTTLNTGSGGDVIGSDDISSVKYQRIKLIHGVDGTNDGDVATTNPLPIRALGYPKTIATDVILPTSSIYAVGDALADSTSAPVAGGYTFTSAARASGGSGMIVDACIATSADVATRLSGELWIFNQAVTAINDNAAFVVSDAEIKTCVGVIPFSLIDAGNNGYAHVTGLNFLYTCVGTANLRFLIRARNTYTPATDTLTFTIKCLWLD
jgi:hypothetical protein